MFEFLISNMNMRVLLCMLTFALAALLTVRAWHRYRSSLSETQGNNTPRRNFDSVRQHWIFDLENLFHRLARSSTRDLQEILDAVRGQILKGRLLNYFDAQDERFLTAISNDYVQTRMRQLYLDPRGSNCESNLELQFALKANLETCVKWLKWGCPLSEMIIVQPKDGEISYPDGLPDS